MQKQRAVTIEMHAKTMTYSALVLITKDSTHIAGNKNEGKRKLEQTRMSIFCEGSVPYTFVRRGLPVRKDTYLGHGNVW